jgi:hypothetical protein
MVLYLISFPEHKHSGYRWTHNEIEFKVRVIIAESWNCPLDAVQRETTFTEQRAE